MVPTSIRARDTLTAAAVTAVLLAVTACGVAYVASPGPGLSGGWRVASAIIVAVVVGTGLAAGTAWKMIGRALRPIVELRRELAAITVADPGRRVPVPDGDDEIGRLVATVNETLDRLQYSVEQQARFSSDASHELRSPIAALRVQVESALMCPDDTDLLKTMRAVLADTERLEEIVSDLLLLARLGATGGAAFAPVDLGELAEAEIARRGFPIKADLEYGLTVLGVRMQLTRVLVNLLNNAERHADRAIEVRVRRDGGDALLSVTDDGRGIAPEDRDRVFERFTRLDEGRSRDEGGSGLGLSIAHNIAAAHGGSLRVEDSPRGARFVLRIPLL